MKNKTTPGSYIPIYAYAKKYGVSKQTVYRWIREGKVKDTKTEILSVERLRIKDETPK